MKTLRGYLAILVLAGTATVAQAQTRARVADTSVAAARRFLDAAERELAIKNVATSRAGWISENFITHDTELLSAAAQADFADALKRLVERARAFDRAALPPDVRRRFLLLKLQLAAPAPPDSAQAAEMARLAAGLGADYGRGGTASRARRQTGVPQPDELSHLLAVAQPDSFSTRGRLDAIGVPMRDRYARFVTLANAGARHVGFADAGAMWRAGYDMPPDSFVAVVDKLWQEVRPLYVQLHAYVRRRLVARYGATLVPPNGMLPVHLLGNMWGQDWSNIADVALPAVAPGGGQSVDLTAILKARNATPVDMFRMGERFYTSRGFDSLPATFWERSLFARPRDRDVVCHASAWYIDDLTDLRVKMCTEPTEDAFQTIHHELGHDFYFRAYKDQPFLYQNGANDGFHEAIGDAIALSITPRYLVQIGLLDSVPAPAGDTLQLLRRALDRVAFLPFGITIDKWRWEVFAGTVPPADYTKRWWELRGCTEACSPPWRGGQRTSTRSQVPRSGQRPVCAIPRADTPFQFYLSVQARARPGRCITVRTREQGSGRLLAPLLQMGASARGRSAAASHRPASGCDGAARFTSAADGMAEARIRARPSDGEALHPDGRPAPVILDARITLFRT